MQLTDDQLDASAAFTDFLIDEDEKYMVIMGAAGTGKSTLMKHLINTVEQKMKLYSLLLGKKREQGDFKIELCATTNKAAAVLTELSQIQARTIHSRLGLVPKQNYKTGETTFVKGRSHQIIYNTLLIIDEASFISNDLLKDIESSTVDCKIVLVGDQYQLAPVRQTVPIMDTISCSKVALEKIMRHGGAIAEAGARFRETVKTGVFTNIVPNGKEIIHVDGPTFQRMIDTTFTDKTYTMDKARILAWTNTKVQQYNDHIRKINGHAPHLGKDDVLITNKAIINGGTSFITDSEVRIRNEGHATTVMDIPGRMVILSDYGEYFLPDDQFAVAALLKFLAKEKNWKDFFEVKNNWLDLRPVYASTVHKSQGSTYDTVFINLADIGRCNITSDVARMLYVALTRASKQVVLYGELPPKYRGGANDTRGNQRSKGTQSLPPSHIGSVPGIPVCAA